MQCHSAPLCQVQWLEQKQNIVPVCSLEHTKPSWVCVLCLDAFGRPIFCPNCVRKMSKFTVCHLTYLFLFHCWNKIVNSVVRINFLKWHRKNQEDTGNHTKGYNPKETRQSTFGGIYNCRFRLKLNKLKFMCMCVWKEVLAEQVCVSRLMYFAMLPTSNQTQENNLHWDSSCSTIQ